jgi:hypothetical protein
VLLWGVLDLKRIRKKEEGTFREEPWVLEVWEPRIPSKGWKLPELTGQFDIETPGSG